MSKSHGRIMVGQLQTRLRQVGGKTDQWVAMMQQISGQTMTSGREDGSPLSRPMTRVMPVGGSGHILQKSAPGRWMATRHATCVGTCVMCRKHHGGGATSVQGARGQNVEPTGVRLGRVVWSVQSV